MLRKSHDPLLRVGCFVGGLLLFEGDYMGLSV